MKVEKRGEDEKYVAKVYIENVKFKNVAKILAGIPPKHPPTG